MGSHPRISNVFDICKTGLCHLKNGIKGSYPRISLLDILQDGVLATIKLDYIAALGIE